MMIKQFDLSERHACRLVGLSRDSYRHPPQSEQNPGSVPRSSISPKSADASATGASMT